MGCVAVLLGAVHPVRWAWGAQPFARQSGWPKRGYCGCASSVLWQRAPFPHPSAKALAPLDSESRQRRHCQKWERWSGGLRVRLPKWGWGRMVYFLSEYTDESVPSARGGNSVQVYKSMDLTWPVRSRQTKPAPFVKSWPFPLSFSPSVNSWWCVSSGTPLQIIFSKISSSISYWLWHLRCLLKHSVDKNRNLCWFPPRAERESLISQGGRKKHLFLKLYIEGEMPGHLVYGVCCCLRLKNDRGE